VKWLFHKTGVDSFDDFELTIAVHEAMYISPKEISTCVRITVGEQQVVTEADTRGQFHQHVSVFVEQGSQVVLVELMEGKGSYVLAVLELDLTKDILERVEPYKHEIFSMVQKNKGVSRPCIKISILTESHTDEEKQLMTHVLSDIQVSAHADERVEAMVYEQLKRAHQDVAHQSANPDAPPEDAPSKHVVLAGGNTGPLEMILSWGDWKKVHVSVKCPPAHRKYKFCIWDSNRDQERGNAPTTEIDLYKVLSVQPDPHRPDCFAITYGVDPKTKRTDTLTFKRVDRHRDVWVEMLSMQIKAAREQKKEKKNKGRN